MVVNTLNNLPYQMHGDVAIVKEQDIIDYLCFGDSEFFMRYFIGEAYLNVHESNGDYPLLHTLTAVREIFEILVNLEDKSELEIRFEEDNWEYIISLAKIGLSKMLGEKLTSNDMFLILNNEDTDKA